MGRKVHVDGNLLRIHSSDFDVSRASKLVVVGAGKASAEMASAFEARVCQPLAKSLPNLRISGWINCPEGSDSALEPAPFITRFAARPMGLNEPTERAVEGTRKILEMVSRCGPEDIVVCLLSGGGSALLTAPIGGVSLTDKQLVAREVAAAGGNIEQLNTIRRALSEVKAGGLARACKAGLLVTLIVSDVLGDSLETIASGPTWTQRPADPQAALETLRELHLVDAPPLKNVVECLQKMGTRTTQVPDCRVAHFIIGSNIDAVRGAETRAIELGYACQSQSASASEGDVLQVAQSVSQSLLKMASGGAQTCWISGGEPTVVLPKHPGKGGRNQQLALAVMQQLRSHGWPEPAALQDLAFISGGTDGEDGPTDAAGAWFDARSTLRAERLGLAPGPFLASADAYHFFDPTDGLIRIGPTGTNVCDLRVAVTGRFNQ